MNAPKYLLMIAALLASPAALADQPFPLPPSSPAANPTAGGFLGDTDRAPDGCDGNRFLAWAKAWRQRAREGYVRDIVQYIPSLPGAPGAHCIKSPDAYFVNYVAAGDYFVGSCLAETKGTLSHVFEIFVNVPFQTQCLGDDVLNNYVKGNQCKMPGGNQKFLDTVMKPCGIAPVQPQMRMPPKATSVDPTYFARILQARPEVKGLVDEHTWSVKGAPRSGGSGGGGCDNPFLCGGSSNGDDESHDAK